MKQLTDEELFNLAIEDLRITNIEPSIFNANIYALGFQKMKSMCDEAHQNSDEAFEEARSSDLLHPELYL